MLATADVQPGDILCVNTGNGIADKLIRLGAAVRNEPNLANHVAIVHHTDKAGVKWVLEGRPGGVGWADARNYLASPYTVSNVMQAKTAKQRNVITAGALKMIGTRYDWAAIVDDAAQAFGIDIPGWSPAFGNQVPGHVVCSSFAAYLYAKASLAHPVGGRNVSPADWVDLILKSHWEG